MQATSLALLSEADVRPTRPYDLHAMARSKPCDDALVVHDENVPRVRQRTTALQWRTAIANARSRSKTSQLFLTGTAFFCFRTAKLMRLESFPSAADPRRSLNSFVGGFFCFISTTSADLG